MHKDSLSTDIKLKLTDSLILSHLNYCNTVYWPALLQKDKYSLQKVQNSCIRYCYNLRKFDHISEKFTESKWFNLEERFHIHMSRIVFKINYSKKPKYLHDKLLKGTDIHDRTTRRCHTFAIPKHRTNLFEKSFSYTAVKTYNALPHDIREAHSLPTFSKRVKIYILNKRDDV